MKKLLSMLLCAVMTVTCIGAVPAHAASSDTRLRVGLTISGASTFAAPALENVSGCKTGYTVGTCQRHRVLRQQVDHEQCADRQAGERCLSGQRYRQRLGAVYVRSGADHIAIRPNSTLTWFKGYKWYGDFVYRRASNGASLL